MFEPRLHPIKDAHPLRRCDGDHPLAARKLEVPPQECLVLEDSATGVWSGVAAGMNVIAIATPFTIAGLHRDEILPHAWVVHDSATLLGVVRQRIEEHDRNDQQG